MPDAADVLLAQLEKALVSVGVFVSGAKAASTSFSTSTSTTSDLLLSTNFSSSGYSFLSKNTSNHYSWGDFDRFACLIKHFFRFCCLWFYD